MHMIAGDYIVQQGDIISALRLPHPAQIIVPVNRESEIEAAIVTAMSDVICSAILKYAIPVCLNIASRSMLVF